MKSSISHSILSAIVIMALGGWTQARELTTSDLHHIDDLAAEMLDHTKALHDEYHEHLEGVRHAEKLDEDITELENIAEDLHNYAHDARPSLATTRRLRSDTNEFIQLSHRISRTINMTIPWLRARDSFRGIQHMQVEAKDVLGIALQIDSYLPVDREVIDNQADRLEKSVKELHDEFHEHLTGYSVSTHLDEDIQELEELVEHIHDLAHGRTWHQISLAHVALDLRSVKAKTAHIESLFNEQARRGVRSRDWIGVEHSRDAITDVLASTYLLERMIRKADSHTRNRDHLHDRPRRDRLPPRRDRHSHTSYHHDIGYGPYQYHR